MCCALAPVAQEFGVSQANPAGPSSRQVSSTVHILSLLLRLRQCCCHLSLLKKVREFVCFLLKSNSTKMENAICVTSTTIGFFISVQTLDPSELQGDGIVLSLEEQLNALSLCSTPSPSGPDPKDTVALNGTRFPSQLFEEISKSTKVSEYGTKIS